MLLLQYVEVTMYRGCHPLSNYLVVWALIKFVHGALSSLKAVFYHILDDKHSLAMPKCFEAIFYHILGYGCCPVTPKSYEDYILDIE